MDPIFLDLEAYKLLEMKNIHLLHETQAKIQAHQNQVTFTGPKVDHDFKTCLSAYETCNEAWSMAWWG
jgi:hypothetical protein